MSQIEAKLEALGYPLPTPPAPAGSYVPFVRVGNVLHLSGTICMQAGKMSHTGKVGGEKEPAAGGTALRDIAYGQEAARVCALNALANVKAAAGSLEAIKRIVMVNGFVNAVPNFADSPKVINGASDFLVEVLGEKGRHARAAVAVTGLPLESTVELQLIVELEG